MTEQTVTINVPMSFTLTEKIVNSIIDAAFYGSSYWTDMVIAGEEQRGEYLSEQVAKGGTLLFLIQNEKAGHANEDDRKLIPADAIDERGIIKGNQGDVDSTKCEVYQLTLDKLVEGIKLLATNIGKNVFTLSGAKCLDPEDIDFEESDLIIQYALFGEVVFG